MTENKLCNRYPSENIMTLSVHGLSTPLKIPRGDINDVTIILRGEFLGTPWDKMTLFLERSIVMDNHLRISMMISMDAFQHWRIAPKRVLSYWFAYKHVFGIATKGGTNPNTYKNNASTSCTPKRSILFRWCYTTEALEVVVILVWKSPAINNLEVHRCWVQKSPCSNHELLTNWSPRAPVNAAPVGSLLYQWSFTVINVHQQKSPWSVASQTLTSVTRVTIDEEFINQLTIIQPESTITNNT